MSRDEAIQKLQRVRSYCGQNRHTYELPVTVEVLVEYLHSIGEDQVAVEVEKNCDALKLLAAHHHFF